MRPPCRSCIAGPVPRYGTWVILVPIAEFEHDATKMRGRARAGRAIGHLVGIGFGVGDEFLEVLDRQILARDQRDRRLGKEGDRREILRRVIKRLLVERLVLRMRADARQDHGVAVGRGIGDALAAIHAAGAADILDHNLLAEDLAHARREYAADRVLRAARSERNDHGDRPGRKVLRIGSRAESQHTGNGCTRNQITHAHERLPRFAAHFPMPRNNTAGQASLPAWPARE